ncbi:hypothetical protein FOS14_19415 [Skermania sp. ID1734]|uniref:hypothetical protein n=1 Tax=Skermania sp. ID1734 TaxID=2597516 RepID=UPI0011805ECB|nr:hypothetical protein [Skermania sp. ID1734]TSD94813.1 hypothetical protein FOS14_19415 [Skermania sp. ID1734]
MADQIVGPCLGQEVGWTDLSESHPPAVRRAHNLCVSCPLLQRCRADLDAAIAEGRQPVDQLWAGSFFNENGLRVSGRRYGVYPPKSQRPVKPAAQAATAAA